MTTSVKTTTTKVQKAEAAYKTAKETAYRAQSTVHLELERIKDLKKQAKAAKASAKGDKLLAVQWDLRIAKAECQAASSKERAVVAKEKMIKAELKLAQAKEGSKKTTEEPKSDSQVWFVVFGCGDTRSDYYGWSCYWKDEMSRKDASKAGTRSADRMGERNFNYYYCKHTTYVTDSFSAFLKKCEKVGINPSKECLAEYGF